MTPTGRHRLPAPRPRQRRATASQSSSRSRHRPPPPATHTVPLPAASQPQLQPEAMGMAAPLLPLPPPTPAQHLFLLLHQPPTAAGPQLWQQPLLRTPMVGRWRHQPLTLMEVLLHLWPRWLLPPLWTPMVVLRHPCSILSQVQSSRTTQCWPRTTITTPTMCLRTRLHPSHLTHMAPAWTRSPELSPSLQTTHSRTHTDSQWRLLVLQC